MKLLSRDRTICGGLFAAQRVRNRRVSKPNTVVIRRAGYGALGRLDRVRGVRLLRLTCRAADGPAQPEMSSRPEDSHLRALPDPYVNLSIHTAPDVDVEPRLASDVQWRRHKRRHGMSRIGIAISGGPNPAEIIDLVILAESLGYESAWVAEGHGGDQFAILAACAMRTSRILLGTSISSVFVRTAPTIAMAASTVDDISA